jgi:hypothetical protein
MSEILVDVILPEATTTEVTSPSIDQNANVYIPGPQGPPGPSNQFKYITGDNQIPLSPTGTETLNFIGSTGISISLDSNLNPYKSIKIDAVPLSGYLEQENILGYRANLSAGADNYYVQYPTSFNSTPRSIVCAFQNAIDDVSYFFSLGSIDPTGFYINFSDILLNNGYYLNIQVKK